ncbi:IS66 family transposase [Crateriforma conspicua]|uniref:Transposase IS66 family protein n=1 Tax=Crateriforma conspicua TaxID=2527996 RepID=A0A5C6FDR8_9PLAN|nr:transposase [Crateriforma conspicua]TWU59600.1 Transposase IS66 family protein [Crateriforma conspicua]
MFVDESPTKEKKAKAWLWVAVAPLFAVFGIFGNRSRESLISLIGDYSGIILNCDRAKMCLDSKRLQWCWAHLKRDIQKLVDSSDGQVRRLGHDLMRQERLLFEHWRRYKAGAITWRGFQCLAGPIRRQFNSLLLRGSWSGNKKLTGFCDELLPRKEHLWTFLEGEGIEPTNNTAERTLRPAVIYRKLSFWTQSAKGSRYVERILTVSETCRLQNRDAYQYLIEAMKAKFANHKGWAVNQNTLTLETYRVFRTGLFYTGKAAGVIREVPIEHSPFNYAAMKDAVQTERERGSSSTPIAGPEPTSDERPDTGPASQLELF